MADEQDRLLGVADQLGGLGDAVAVGALHGETVAVRRQRLRHVELLQRHVVRELDIGGSRRARHRDADRLADDLVGLVGIFDRAGILHRILDQRLLTHELDAAAADAPLGDAGALAAEEDHRRVLDQAALDRRHHVGHAGPQRADRERRIARHPRRRLGHEAGGRLMVRRYDRPAALLGLQEEVDEVRIGDAEERLDAFHLEQFENALVDGRGHDRSLLVRSRLVRSVRLAPARCRPASPMSRAVGGGDGRSS